MEILFRYTCYLFHVTNPRICPLQTCAICITSVGLREVLRRGTPLILGYTYVYRFFCHSRSLYSPQMTTWTVSVDTLSGKQHPARGNWIITPHPVVRDKGPGEGITAPSPGGSKHIFGGTVTLYTCYVYRVFLPLTFTQFNVTK